MTAHTKKSVLLLAFAGVVAVLVCGSGGGCEYAHGGLYQRLQWSPVYPRSWSEDVGQWSRKTGDLWYDRAGAGGDDTASALLDDDFALVVRVQMSSPYGGFKEVWFIENAHEAFSVEVCQKTSRVGPDQVKGITIRVHSIPMQMARLARDKLLQLSIFQLGDLGWMEFGRAGATSTTDAMSYLVSAAAPGESNQFICGGIVWDEEARQGLRGDQAGLAHLKVTEKYVEIIRCIEQLSDWGSTEKTE